MKGRDKFIGVSSVKFSRRFKNDEDCYKYMADIKWGSGHVCKHCGHTHYYQGEKPYSRRCSRCRYDESPTAGTMFDKLKFSLLAAFHVAFKISTKKKGMPSLELSEEFELRQKTCRAFKWKIQKAMQSTYTYPLEGDVYVDESYIGGPDDQKRGRSKESKELVQVALEVIPGKVVGRAYARVIDDASSKSLQCLFDEYVAKDAQVITDEWNGYLPIMKQCPNMERRKSDEGNNFPDLHIHIMNIKGWLRGIHHHCTKEQLQGHLDEYHFRYNRRNSMDPIFGLLIKRMVLYKPVRLVNNKLDVVA